MLISFVTLPLVRGQCIAIIMSVCLSVCLSVHLHISKTTCPDLKKFSVHVTCSRDMPMWLSGQLTRPPCAVARDVLRGRGLHLRPSASAYQRIVSYNSYAHDEQGVNPGQIGGFDCVLCL